jgi:transposase
VREQTRAIEQERLRKLAATPAAENGSHAMVRLIAPVLGVGIETADMLVSEVLSRHWRDRKAVTRFAGLTARRMRAENDDASGGLRVPVTLASGAA